MIPGDITVVLSAVLPSREHFWMMDETCQQFGITPFAYGLGETPGGWLDILYWRLRRAVMEVRSSHVLYSDSRDAFFLTGLEEITQKYNDMRQPGILFSAISHIDADACCASYKRVAWKNKHYRYLACGGFLAHRDALLNALNWMERHMPDFRGLPEDVPPLWCRYMEDYPHLVDLDHGCEIFQNTSAAEGELQIVNGRIYNRRTNCWPCLIHFNGGYSDPIEGKWAVMEGTWKLLGHTQHPPWLLNAR